ncbi:MAG: Gfo/Idh/MocA family oxidoreductase [Acidobacteria bacterium]|nr:Gfo/Idh/MocA family oxidoreductase [Acidobacteriota bacterium]
MIGGGRWARVWYRVLTGLRPQPRIHWASSRNHNGVADWLSEQSAVHGVSLPPTDLYAGLEALVAAARPGMAIVANLPAEHGRTVRMLLDHGCHVLVEKPFVPTLEEADALVELADRRERILAVGLELMLATYVRGFRQVVEQSGLEFVAAHLIWHDAYSDVRHFTVKTPDLTTGIVGDLLPHVLSLLTAIRGAAGVSMDEGRALRGGLETELRFRYGDLPVTASLSRVAERPARLLQLEAASGARSTLDFTTEPGTIITPIGHAIVDDRWAIAPRPLDALLQLFLKAIAQPGGDSPILARLTRHIVAGTEAATNTMTDSQLLLLRPFLLRDTDSSLPTDALVALREQVAAPLVAEGLVTNPKAEDELNRWAMRAWAVIHRFARHPFTTQREMAEALGLERSVLVRLNRALRQSEPAQQLMVGQGVAMKYWENTILPLLQAGVIETARQGVSRHPFRVGVYPGVSCMFHCSFCGRDPDATYARDSVAPGNALFDAMFRDAPADPYTFYVSGGLEPLTNPGIGQLIAAGAARGFRLSLYTNGFMLTPQLLARQPGIWDLDTLRISLYGVDATSTTEVTCHPKAYAQVVQNAIAFLQARNERGAPLKFGFNFVVLPGRVEEVLALAELITSINRAAGGRQVDFLTLREDYSVSPEDGLGRGERERLAEIFEQLRERVLQPDLCDLQIDLGYALHSLSEGGWPTPLDMVAHRAMRPRGYPQISVVVDLLGDVYLYREAGFLDRPGARRYAIGRVGPTRSLHQVVTEFLASGQAIEPEPGDTGYFDIFDHVVTHLLNQADDDATFGIPFAEGPIRDRERAGGAHAPLAHPTLAHPTLAHPTLAHPTLAHPAAGQISHVGAAIVPVSIAR